MPEPIKEEQPADERSAVKEFLDAIPHEGQPIGKDNGQPAAAPSAEKGTEKVTPPATEKPGDENIPFHKHPRFKQLVEERKQLKEQVEQTNKRLAELESKATAPATPAGIPAWFTELYGANQKAWELYQTYDAAEKVRIKQEIIEESKKATVEAEQSAKAMDEWVTGNLQALKDEGIQFDENKLLKVLVDYSPTDSAGNIDFRKGLELLNKIEEAEAAKATQKASAKKEIAATTTSSVNGGGKPNTALKPSQLRKMSWHDAIQ